MKLLLGALIVVLAMFNRSLVSAFRVATRSLGRTRARCHGNAFSRSGGLRPTSASFCSSSGSDVKEKIDYFSVPAEANNEIEFGEYGTIRSDARSGRKYVDVKDLGTENGPKEGEMVWIRGRVTSVRAKGNSCFVVIRAGSFYTVQALHFKDKENADVSKSMIKYIGNIQLESIVDVCGVVAGANVKSCSQDNVELQIRKMFVVSRAPTVLPFLYEDACRSQEEIEASQGEERPFASVSQEARLNTRWLDLRTPANTAILRIRSGIMMLFRESLTNQGFMEINTPKLISGESEGGANAFKIDYFGKDGCLAQSPQLYKQMAICSDFPRVFEVGPVFRAENSNTRRHLCEFTGLDMEMAINEHYEEALEVCHDMFKHIFMGLEEKYSKEILEIRKQYPSEPLTFTDKPCIIHWPDGIKMLNDAGHDAGMYDDLTGAHELALGALVKEKYNTDFFILDQYPLEIRPFYTMNSPFDEKLSNSYDMFIRGQEICSGAQRCHEPELLEKNIVGKGMSVEPLQSYIESFRHGCPPHAGAGIGLDRVVFLYLGLDNVRKGSMFPRDPNRLTP